MMQQEDLNHQLGIATLHGELSKIEDLIGAGAYVNSATIIEDQLQTPLFIAISKNNKAAVLILIMRGAYVHLPALNNKALTPLHYAAMLGFENVFTMLLDEANDRDIDVKNIKDCTGNTALHHAAIKGYATITRLLLERKCVNIDAKNNRGFTPILEAAINGHTSIVQLLLDAGADPLLSDDEKIHSILAAACSTGQDELVAFLLKEFKFDSEDMEESLERLKDFEYQLHVECTSKTKEHKCAQCLKNEAKIDKIFRLLKL